uniref:SLAM family member 5-like isoform X2 n=1 Tax=Monopterus albus TaxID=43700 RepID=UPI0009B3B14F|nr:SLAM family member 5-like isoform X2 [Monopterus albus]
MRVLLFAFLQVALADPPKEVSGYIGNTIILPSGAEPPWTLRKIYWSIFTNNTWIATYYNKEENTERISQYKGRLSLNITSGDLTIRNLTTKDAMEYTVKFTASKGQTVSKIKLTVKQRLQEPTIQRIQSARGGCWKEVHCSSSDKDVDFSWQVKPPSVTTFTRSNPASNFLLVFLTTTQNPVEVTCTSNRTMENASSVVTLKYDDCQPQPPPHPQPQPRERHLALFFGGFLGALTAIFICIFKEKLCPSTSTL